MSGPDKSSAKPDKSAVSGGKNLTREERLAAKLRENLRRRKAQARATTASESAGSDSESASDSLSPRAGDESRRLPKPPPES
ncbi:hypothetical protein [Novosphingobium sp. BW1]|uniref:hypothetical protein n=1 Tax=Novosphingobium sp. BW1 TaxID=2592621 RepID=UPI00196828AB|nr:hypothetical protein [Novosphingobium sp. BW1]